MTWLTGKIAGFWQRKLLPFSGPSQVSQIILTMLLNP